MEPATRNPNPATDVPVLLVEDDIDLGEALQTALSADRVALTFAHNASEALDAIHHTSFQLVLLDLGLPGINGFDPLQRLREDPAARHLPVIVLTAKNSASDKLRGFELGANDYITKPFELVELRARVRAALRSQRLQMDLLRANQALE